MRLTALYGDVDRVPTDTETLKEIMGRQGTALLIDVIAEHMGEAKLKFKLDPIQTARMIESIVTYLQEACNERT